MYDFRSLLLPMSHLGHAPSFFGQFSHDTINVAPSLSFLDVLKSCCLVLFSLRKMQKKKWHSSVSPWLLFIPTDTLWRTLLWTSSQTMPTNQQQLQGTSTMCLPLQSLQAQSTALPLLWTNILISLWQSGLVKHSPTLWGLHWPPIPFHFITLSSSISMALLHRQGTIAYL